MSGRRETKTMAEGLITGLKEALAYQRGKRTLRERTVELPAPAPKWTTARIRKLRSDVLHMSQPVFAALLNVKTATVRSWEQGQKTPSGAAARLLQLLAADPQRIERMVA
jgi:DNA-binding transcriptional regulator YiaG